MSALPLTMLMVGGSGFSDNFSGAAIRKDMAQAQPRGLAGGKLAAATSASSPRPDDATSTVFFRQLESGVRSDQELDEEWSSWIGAVEPTTWDALKLKESLRLSMILTEVNEGGANALRIMAIHSLSPNGGADDFVTLYDREIDGMEEANTRAALPVAHGIAKDLSAKNQSVYKFNLDKSRLKRTYDQRAPKGQGAFSSPRAGDLNWIANLVNHSTLQNDEYVADVTTDGQAEQIRMKIRKTDIGTVTFDISIVSADGRHSRRFGLIYE